MYGVVYKDSYYTPGDERSRTNPGHGYPESTTYYDVLKTFTNFQGLEKWIKDNSTGYMPKEYKVYELTELQVATNLVVTVKPKGV